MVSAATELDVGAEAAGVDAVAVAAVLHLQLLEAGGIDHAPQRRLVQDLALGRARLGHPAGLGDGRALLVGQRLLHGAFLRVLLAEPLHGQLVGGLGWFVGHEFTGGGGCARSLSIRERRGESAAGGLETLRLRHSLVYAGW